MHVLPADRFLNVMENYIVEDTIRVELPENREQRRDKLRAELLRYNSKDGSSQPENDRTFTGYLEPTSDGYYPGLEDGLMG